MRPLVPATNRSCGPLFDQEKAFPLTLCTFIHSSRLMEEEGSSSDGPLTAAAMDGTTTVP